MRRPAKVLPDGPLSALRSGSVAAIAGGVMALAFPPFPFGFLAHIALALALLSVRATSIRTMMTRGFAFGFVFHLATMYWTGWVSVPGMLTTVAVLGLYVAVIFGAYGFLYRVFGERAVWLMPVLWVAHEYLRGLGDLAFPWANLSLSQVHYLNIIQFADLTGDLGVSFWVALMNVIVYQTVRRWMAPRSRPSGYYVTALIFLVVLPFLYGRGALKRLTSEESVRVAVLQGDIDSFHKWDTNFVDQSFAVYETQSHHAAEHGAELIVWPETAAPVYIRANLRYHRRLRTLQSELGVPLLFGTLEFKNVPGGGYLSYNAALGINNGNYETAFHAKLHLVPLGEWIPFSDEIQVLKELEVGGAHFTAGKRIVLFDHPKGPYAAVICYESVFPDIVRQFANSGARFIVNITNDGWYGMSSGPTQHALIAIYRAIETRRPIARSANTASGNAKLAPPRRRHGRISGSFRLVVKSTVAPCALRLAAATRTVPSEPFSLMSLRVSCSYGCVPTTMKGRTFSGP